MASSVRSFTVAGWGSSGIASPADMQEPHLKAWLTRYSYATTPSLTFGTPGSGLSVRVYRADGGGADHEFAAALGLNEYSEVMLIKEVGALTDFLEKIAPTLQLSASSAPTPAATAS